MSDSHNPSDPTPSKEGAAPAPPEGGAKAASAPEDPTDADQPAPLAKTKRIVAFSDGTGNSSGKLFRTNVYRLYEALNLGSRRKDDMAQIAYYDNGVGSSNFRLSALLGGVFGIGLKRNLFNLYRYVCRNYNDGDQIFAFGFSRGAFTIRLLVALICTQGIVPYKDERALQRNCADALRRFLSENAPDRFKWLFVAVRWLRDALIHASRRVRKLDFNVEAKWQPEVEFVGVWDTVSAYGGPVVEITRAIDQWLWPLTMTDHVLHPKVKEARHALALDDERDSFSPLLWDEAAEQRAKNGIFSGRNKLKAEWTPERRKRAGARIKQVWFAGMHSDVGGGYPDDSLAYVSLKWMIDEIGTKLDFIESEALRIREFANPLGPMHDSRKGAAAYYRYQPRKIAAMLHHGVEDTLGFQQTLILRDPIIGEEEYRPQGLLLECKIHPSVLERISVGNDNYAPIVLPRDFSIEPRLARGEQADAAAHLAEPERAAARGEIQENAWDFVWKRRLGYFATVAATLMPIALPLLLDHDLHRLLSIEPLERMVKETGQYVYEPLLPWYGIIAPYAVTALLAILALNWWVAGQESQLRDTVRVAWWDAIEGRQLDSPKPSSLRTMRNSFAYQWPLQTLKWRFLPGLLGIGALLTLPYLALRAITA